ncbi:hypothetical protein JCM3765_003424 [Sporobolomyces pararoseus]
MHFSSLPPELVHQIIVSTVPHTFHTTTYKDRQNILCHLSLVSRLFHSIAQPLLLEIIWVKSLRQVKLLPLKEDGEGGNGRKDVVRWAVIEIPKVKSADASQEEFEETLRKFSSVANLTLSNSSHKVYDLEILELFHNLGSLHLSGQFRSLSPTQSILHIHSLTLCRGFDKLYASLLDPATVPNLRAFALGDTEWSPKWKLSGKLKAHAHLQQTSFDFMLWDETEDEYLYSKKDIALVDFQLGDLPRAVDPQQQVAHVRVYDLHRPVSTGNNQYEDPCKYLDDFAMALKSKPPPSLQSLYLDSSLLPISTLPDDLRESLEDASNACRELGIEIVYEQTPSDFSLDPVLSPEFGARQKERVRSEAVGKVDS